MGAARIYVGDDNWQDLIADLLLDRGAVAVLQGGIAGGLRWEMEAVGSVLRRDRILLFLPFGLHWSRSRRDADYSAFRHWANHCFAPELPEEIGGDDFFLYFTKTRTLFLDPSEPIPRRHALQDILIDLEANHSLRPWRLVNWGRFWTLVFLGTILTVIVFAVKTTLGANGINLVSTPP